MAITFVDVPTYLVFSYGGPTGNQGADAAISLGIANGFALLRFFPEGSQVPPNSKQTHVSGKPIYYVNYRYAQFGNIVDLLRMKSRSSSFSGTSNPSVLYHDCRRASRRRRELRKLARARRAASVR